MERGAREGATLISTRRVYLPTVEKQLERVEKQKAEVCTRLLVSLGYQLECAQLEQRHFRWRAGLKTAEADGLKYPAIETTEPAWALEHDITHRRELALTLTGSGVHIAFEANEGVNGGA